MTNELRSRMQGLLPVVHREPEGYGREAALRSMRRPGFALIAVFWIVMVVGLFAAIVASRIGFDLDRSGWALGMGKARAAADGAVEEAAFQLVGRINAGAPVLDLRDLAEFEVRIDDVPVRVSVEDEDGKIDLNGAQPELLAVLIQAVMRENKGLAAEDAADAVRADRRFPRYRQPAPAAWRRRPGISGGGAGGGGEGRGVRHRRASWGRCLG